MEDSEKVETIVVKVEEKDENVVDIENQTEKSITSEVIDVGKVVIEQPISEPKAELELAVSDKGKPDVVQCEEPEQVEIQETLIPEKEELKGPPGAIEECDTGGDEIPDEAVQILQQVKAIESEMLSCSESDQEPILLTNLTTVVAHEEPQIESSVKKISSEVVNLDDDDEDDEIDDEDDSVDDVEDDDEDDVEGVSNEALNDDDEDDVDLFDDDENEKREAKATSSRESIDMQSLNDDDDDDFDEDDDEDIADLKDESNGAVVIGSSDEEDEPAVQRTPVQVRTHQQQLPQQSKHQKQEVPKYNFDDELDYEDDEVDDDDDYDDDDLMNAVVTSASKGLSPPKKRKRSVSLVSVSRQREAHQINVLTRRINYGRVAKKKSLNWLYNKRKREAYKLILPKRKPSTIAEAMRGDQSGGLLQLKISPPTVAPKPIIKASTSTPTISRVESSRPGPASRTQNKSFKQECVIDLDSSPEKTQDKVSSRQSQSDVERKLEIDLKKPPDSKKEKQHEEEEERQKMQQTDKVRDSIQKSTEDVEEVKLAEVARITCEQNKENLQSNEVLKKESDDMSTKNDLEVKETVSTEESMETNEEEEATESTIKASEFTISSVTSVKVDIKEEKPDKLDTPSIAAEEEINTASKVTIEDVQENERSNASPHVAPAAGATKRRRSSSAFPLDKSKSSKSTAGATATAEDDDDDEEYIHPTKKLREELQSAYPAHDRILNEYIEKTSNDSIDSIQRHLDQMLSEITTLNDMIKAKEVEWNNMLHLKKVKEEICFRLTRRKQCMEIMTTKVGEAGHSAGLDEDYVGNESAIVLGKNTPAAKQNPQLSSTPISAAINSISSNICNFTAVSSSSSAAPTTAQLIIQNRANMKSSDLVKEKANTLRLHRNILPKPTASPNTSAGGANSSQQQTSSTNGPSSTQQPNASNQPILNSYLTSTDSVQQLVDMMNGHHNHSGLHNGGTSASNSQAAMVGRQGPFKDVRSIIADFRQQHPEVVPRRGRRNSRPSSNDSSSHSTGNANQVSTNHNSVNSFKDVLAPFSKSQGAVRSAGGQQQNPPYPEVTLHPVSTPLNASGGQDQPTGSLLHGILTKFSRPNESANTKSGANQASANYISNFSPTLARLLTAPERISPSGTASGANQSHHSLSAGGGGDVSGNNTNNSAHHAMPGFGVNLSKVVGHNSEITITPVMNSMHQQSILQQQLQQQQLKDVLTRAAAAVGANNNIKDEHFLKLSSFAAPTASGNDDDAEDSVDRLVIDEGVDIMNVGGEEHQRIAPHAIGQEFNENEVPVCQGCKKHEAQFVCAGCGNQWYCSRECQVTAWDDHSEVCTATKQIRNNFNMLKSKDLKRDEEYFIVRRRKQNKFYPQFY